MHPRHALAQLDLVALAARHEPLRAHVGGGHIDFEDDGALRYVDADSALTAALLAELDIHAELPADRLCPAIPSRLNYIHWIEDIVDTPEALGLDIGTGAVAVYAALACALQPHWRMVGTDTDERAIASARHMLERTAAHGDPRGIVLRLELRHVQPEPLISGAFDFVVCNPPFYADAAEREACRTHKRTPHSQTAAAEAELYTPGGEVAFVSRMIDDSIDAAVGWASSMVGRLASVGALVAKLRRHHITNYALAEFVQGRTRRWAVAWSLGARRLPDAVARPRAPALARWLPASNERVLGNRTFDSDAALHAWLASLPTLPAKSVRFTAGAGVRLDFYERCWTRDARRRRARGTCTPTLSPSPILGVHISCSLRCTWTFGYERALFDSLSTHLGGCARALTPHARAPP